MTTALTQCVRMRTGRLSRPRKTVTLRSPPSRPASQNWSREAGNFGGIRSLIDGTHKGPMAEVEARDWASKYPKSYAAVSRIETPWEVEKP
jgi:hypothetical protein